jgi:hypothetical protein
MADLLREARHGLVVVYFNAGLSEDDALIQDNGLVNAWALGVTFLILSLPSVCGRETFVLQCLCSTGATFVAILRMIRAFLPRNGSIPMGSKFVQDMSMSV